MCMYLVLLFLKILQVENPLTYLLNNKYILLIVIEICLGVMTC